MTNAEIQVGEYIRHKTGYIDKVVAAHYVSDDMKNYPENPYIKHYRDKYTLAKKGYLITSQNIKNHDFNIIKLIEVGDYVKRYFKSDNKEYIDNAGSYVCNVGESDGKSFIELDCGQDGTEIIYNADMIKSIVTKEQFKSMEYEVREDD